MTLDIGIDGRIDRSYLHREEYYTRQLVMAARSDIYVNVTATLVTHKNDMTVCVWFRSCCCLTVRFCFIISGIACVAARKLDRQPYAFL